MSRCVLCGIRTTLVVWAFMPLAATADAGTIATFSDPAFDGTTPMFELSGSTLSGGWANPGTLPLELFTPISGQTFGDAGFTMTDLTVLDPFGSLSGGAIEFLDNGGGLILRIDFNSARSFAPFGFGASEFVGQGVTFSGPIIPGSLLVEDTFSFSFANQVTTPGGFTWTAAFTSSAVPEPATLCLLALGGLPAVFRRRRHPARQ